MIQQMGCIMATKMHQEAVDHAMASSFMSFLFNHMDSDEDDGDDEYQDTCTWWFHNLISIVDPTRQQIRPEMTPIKPNIFNTDDHFTINFLRVQLHQLR